MRIGIMGGTFNPIHNGHLLIAENAREQYGLDKILFIPAGKPPHKQNQEILSNRERIAMTQLTISSNPYFELSTIETDSSAVSYSYITLEKLHEQYPKDEFYFILGADSLKDMGKWRNPERILQLAVILAAVRDDYELEALSQKAAEMTALYGGRIGTIRTPLFQVSSHGLRQRISQEQTIKYLVPEAVEEYIYSHKLYQ